MSASEDEDDYMSMAIQDTTQQTVETSIQRRRRLQREGEQRAQVKSKAETAAEIEARRNEGLSTSLDSSSKGSKLLAKLGYKPGDRLGAAGNPYALAEPIGLETKDGRGGIGMDSEKKRKVREAADRAKQQVKRAKVEEGEFRERAARERAEQRMEGQWWGAMRVAEEFDYDQLGHQDHGVASELEHPQTTANADPAPSQADPGAPSTLKRPNLLWRPLPRQRAEQERERRIRHDLGQSLPRHSISSDPEEDAHDRLALGKEEVEIDLTLDDPEVDAYMAELVTERLEKVVTYLRETYRYCFWCKHQYANFEMDGCPGKTEDDHD